ncbi:hypothetical protein FQN57_004736 [Myotisia sp. PD_48]|nr:hypothetical protein FQN57_004736 [Myotisia sp. PD_48]
MGSPISDASNPKRQYYNFPRPIEGPDVPYKSSTESNPILRGRVLQVAGNLVYSSSFLQSILWRNAGFNSLRLIKDIQKYEPIYNPTVFPAVSPGDDTSSIVSNPALSTSTNRDVKTKRYYTSSDYHNLYKSGELTPTMVVEALYPLIRRKVEPRGEHSVAFADTKIDLVRAAAEASTQRYKNGHPLGPLDGVPVAVKDEVDLTGYKKTLSSNIDFTDDAAGTSWCAKKWEEAGAIIIGKTSMHELGLDTTNNNPITGTPKNPHNSEYYTGGSSGGSGYVVAAGLVPIALGADGGGSIRIPSNYCGIYGLKTSHGRVSAAPTKRLATTTGVFGPMAACLDDLALAYRIMAMPDPSNSESSGFPSPLLNVPLVVPQPKIIGIYQDWINRSDPAVLALFNKAIDYYRDKKGYEIVDISIPYLVEGGKSHALTILSEISSGLTTEQVSQLSAPNKILISVGCQGSAQDLIASQKMRSLLMSHLSYIFQRNPGIIIATPTTPTVGSRILQGDDLAYGISNANASLRSMEYVYLANFTGCPAISCPMGYDESTRMPVGIMGMGEWGGEEALIEWGRDGEGILTQSAAGSDEADNVATTAASTVVPATSPEGIKTPDTEKGGKWVDVVRLVKHLNTAGQAPAN